MRKYLKVTFIILAIICVSCILIWLGSLNPTVSKKLWIISLSSLVLAVILYVGYSGKA